MRCLSVSLSLTFVTFVTSVTFVTFFNTPSPMIAAKKSPIYSVVFQKITILRTIK